MEEMKIGDLFNGKTKIVMYSAGALLVLLLIYFFGGQLIVTNNAGFIQIKQGGSRRKSYSA